MNINKGISLIMLVITIIVIIILAGAVILSLSNNNPINQAKEAAFKANIDAYNSELNLTLSAQYTNHSLFIPDSLNAGLWNGDESKISGTIKEYIPSITVEDGKKFEIQSGKLVYIDTNTVEKNYAANMNVTNKNSMLTYAYKVTSAGDNILYEPGGQLNVTEPGSLANQAIFWKSGTLIYTGSRGFSVLVFDSKTLNLISQKTYDTYGNINIGDTMANDLISTPNGRIIIISINDAVKINATLRSALVAIGLPNATSIGLDGNPSYILPGERMGLIYAAYINGPLINFQYDNTGSKLLTMEKTLYANP